MVIRVMAMPGDALGREARSSLAPCTSRYSARSQRSGRGPPAVLRENLVVPRPLCTSVDIRARIPVHDCTGDFALAMDKAKSFSGPKVIAYMDTVSSPPSIRVYTYAQGSAELKKGQKIDYTGVSGAMDFNKYHNVDGAWSVVRAWGSRQAAYRRSSQLPRHRS
jgi:hypothetical protein